LGIPVWALENVGSVRNPKTQNLNIGIRFAYIFIGMPEIPFEPLYTALKDSIVSNWISASLSLSKYKMNE
jgi:hypothetical protein